MTETKSFDPAILASITTGIMLVEHGFSSMHEAAEWIMGHPVWTHEFADKALWDRMGAAVLAQFPEMPVNKDDAKVDWQKVADDVRARYGENVSVTRGSSERTTDPITTLIDAIGPDKPVIAIVG